MLVPAACNCLDRLNFTLDGMAEAQRTVDRLQATWRKLEEAARTRGPLIDDLAEQVAAQRWEFGEAMDDDLNISRALAALHEIASLANRADIRGETALLLLDAFQDLDRVLGVLKPEAASEELLPAAIQALVDQQRGGAQVARLRSGRSDPERAAGAGSDSRGHQGRRALEASARRVISREIPPQGSAGLLVLVVVRFVAIGVVVVRLVLA